MMRPFLAYLLVFLAGFAVSSGSWWWLSQGKATHAVPGALPSAAATPAESSASQASATPLTDPAETTPAERARAVMEQALPALRSCGELERASRCMLLLAQLKREGPAGTDAIRAFLATGEDLELGPLLKLPGYTMSSYRTLRMAMLEMLSHVKEPGMPAVLRDECLRSLRTANSMDVAMRFTSNLEHLAPGASRSEIIATVKRIATDSPPGSDVLKDDMTAIAKVMAHYKATELLPLAESRVLENPERRLYDYLGALWKLPPEIRQQATERILAEESVRSAVKDRPPLTNLDYRIPSVRDYALQWFDSLQSATAKADVIESMGAATNWGPMSSFRGDPWQVDHDTGTPGTASQAQARLAFLDEIAARSPDLLIQQKISAARRLLKEQLAGKK